MFISKSSKNQFNIAGHVSKNFIKTGQYGPFGMMVIAVDDGYYSKKESKFVERTQFISVDVGKLKNMPEVNVGDYFDLDGKFEVEQWTDKTTQKPRSEVKMKATKVNCHIPANITKVLKDQGFVRQQQPPQQRPAQQGGYNNQQQPPQQGGYNQAPPPQQPQQQGGYNQAPPPQQPQQQPQTNGYAQQRGGYNQAPPQGATPNHWDYDDQF